MADRRSSHPYRDAVASLNTHFHAWVDQQKRDKPDKLWLVPSIRCLCSARHWIFSDLNSGWHRAPGAADYLRHAATLQREFANAGGIWHHLAPLAATAACCKPDTVHLLGFAVR